MMDSKLIEVNKHKLLAEKSHLEDLLKGVASSGKAKYPEFGNKEDENAAEVTQYETNVAEERDLQDRLNKIEAALLRIESGSYGICQIGGEEMPRERLEAAPEAENCVAHEEA